MITDPPPTSSIPLSKKKKIIILIFVEKEKNFIGFITKYAVNSVVFSKSPY